MNIYLVLCVHMNIPWSESVLVSGCPFVYIFVYIKY